MNLVSNTAIDSTAQPVNIQLTCKSDFTSSSNNKSCTILRTIDCDFTNINYPILCSICNKQYIGETGRKLKYRFTEHLRDIRKNEDTAGATHFNQTTTSHRTSLHRFTLQIRQLQKTQRTIFDQQRQNHPTSRN